MALSPQLRFAAFLLYILGRVLEGMQFNFNLFGPPEALFGVEGGMVGVVGSGSVRQAFRPPWKGGVLFETRKGWQVLVLGLST